MFVLIKLIDSRNPGPRHCPRPKHKTNGYDMGKLTSSQTKTPLMVLRIMCHLIGQFGFRSEGLIIRASISSSPADASAPSVAGNTSPGGLARWTIRLTTLRLSLKERSSSASGIGLQTESKLSQCSCARFSTGLTESPTAANQKPGSLLGVSLVTCTRAAGRLASPCCSRVHPGLQS